MSNSFRGRVTRAIRSMRFNFGIEMGLYPKRTEGDLILMYHNVFPHSMPGLNPRNIGQREFEEQMVYLKKRYDVVSLREMCEEKSRTKRIAITFDDGLLNNLRYAVPTLEEHGICGTLFVCTSYLRGRSILWPEHLALTGFRTGKSLEFDGVVYSHRRGNRYVSESGKRLTQVLMEQPINRIEAFLDEVEKKTGYKPTDDLNHEYRWRVMRGEELRSLTESSTVEIASHGISHSNFNLLSDEEALEELKDSKEYLESASGQKVSSIAYPFGLYSRRTLDLAEQCGYKRQFAVDFQHNEDESDPRIWNRLGLYNDRSMIEQMHLVNARFHGK
jgi:peptidoglycan/xylan/chitin deacetylase (PgdA/CDA1 family)